MSRERGKGFLWGIVRKLNAHGKGKHGRRRTARENRATRRSRRKQARKVFRKVVAEAIAAGTIGELFGDFITINGNDSSVVDCLFGEIYNDAWENNWDRIKIETVHQDPDRLEDHERHLVDCLFDEPDTDEAIGGPPLFDEPSDPWNESDEPTDEA